MTRVALVGAEETGTDTSFAHLRTAQLRDGLRAAGHDVHVIGGGTSVPSEAECVVSAGTHGPTRDALAMADHRPLCIDLPGDPFADAQAAAWADDGERSPQARAARIEAVAADAAAVFSAAIARADAFTTISTPSRFALLGQLGLAGRLVRVEPGREPAFRVPNAWHFPGVPEAEPRGPGLRVALFGSFNTWFDEDTLLAGLLRAMERAPLEVVCIGGAVPGHHVAGRARFEAGARASRHAARFRFLPRLPTDALLAELRSCQITACLDRPGVEPETGSRTRLLFAAHQGLRAVATATCELSRDMAAGGWLRPVPPRDPDALAGALLDVAQGPPLPDRAPLRARHALDATVAPLTDWVAAPRRMPRAPWADAHVEALRARDAARAELAALRASPTYRMLDAAGRPLRALRRRHG
jgi:glycosyltransferase involved in cell wall biosynthesis